MESKIVSCHICNYLGKHISSKLSIETYVNYLSLSVLKFYPDLFLHQQRVSVLAYTIADEMKLPKYIKKGVSLASKIHDIGKIIIDPKIINKPGALTDDEFSVIKEHPLAWNNILLQHKDAGPIAIMKSQHHETNNGEGYPYGLKQDKLMIESKIMAVADRFDAMAHKRSYRSAMGYGAALKEVQQGKGTLLDAEVVDALERVLAKTQYQLLLNVVFRQPIAAIFWIKGY